eukprot:CAMPEP_0177649694 /NCGR_PEP_ID=MMETSP0447-20121125/11531_1 /TAXON_ID=0 /ORGANISM="Stygamoeba regulata, Strain BSH-02190019" /LENGTH=140 /DNA_ID=CAMNT_0019152485 /DNA_START=99 /DNA_END=518 /DNA_ORIENTATION=+
MADPSPTYYASGDAPPQYAQPQYAPEYAAQPQHAPHPSYQQPPPGHYQSAPPPAEAVYISTADKPHHAGSPTPGGLEPPSDRHTKAHGATVDLGLSSGAFGREPQRIQCPHCHEDVVTQVRFEMGLFAWLAAAGLCFFLW